jgi:hypothetical protein
MAGVGEEHFPNNYYLANSLENIFYKEKYYSELAFQYWLWKNKLNKIKKDTWIGFCQKRRFWIKKNSAIHKVNTINLKKNIITIAPKEWNKYESVIVNSIFVNNINIVSIGRT